MNTKERRLLLAAGAAGAVLLIVVVVTAWVLAKDHRHPIPQVSAASDTSFRRANPTIYCAADGTKCEQHAGKYGATVPVAVGDVLTLTVPKEVWVAPWTLDLEYVLPDGKSDIDELYFRPETRYTVIVPSTANRTLVSAGVKIPALAQDGSVSTAAFWNIDTTPTTFRR